MTQSQDQQLSQSAFVTGLHSLRTDIKTLAKHVKDQHSHPALLAGPLDSSELEARNETHANITLAYRHLEDAAMRLGKAIQAHDGGSSVYDKAEA